MSITKIRALVALVFTAALLGGVWWHLTRQVLPRLMVEGNRTLLERAAAACEDYYADHQHWPAGPPLEIFHRLAGRTEDQLIEWRAAQAHPRTEAAPPLETIRREAAIPVKNYLRLHTPKAENAELVDAWSNSLQYDFPDDDSRPATLTSVGPDGILGTADDQSVTLNKRPRRITPTLAMFEAVTNKQREQEFRAAENELRRARREAARQAAAAARQAP